MKRSDFIKSLALMTIGSKFLGKEILESNSIVKKSISECIDTSGELFIKDPRKIAIIELQSFTDKLKPFQIKYNPHVYQEDFQFEIL